MTPRRRTTPTRATLTNYVSTRRRSHGMKSGLSSWLVSRVNSRVEPVTQIGHERDGSAQATRRRSTTTRELRTDFQRTGNAGRDTPRGVAEMSHKRVEGRGFLAPGSG